MEKTKKTKTLIEHFLASLDHPVKPLTAWEEGFISSITEWFEKRGDLSDKQFEILERIYAEKTA